MYVDKYNKKKKKIAKTKNYNESKAKKALFMALNINSKP